LGSICRRRPKGRGGPVWPFRPVGSFMEGGERRRPKNGLSTTAELYDIAQGAAQGAFFGIRRWKGSGKPQSARRGEKIWGGEQKT